MDLKSNDIVVLGAFNPAILSPPWLVAQRVVPEPSVPPNLEFGEDIVFVLDECRWKINPERLILEPQSAVSPVEKIKHVLKLLPHTPIRAVGFNFHFHCARSDWKGGQPSLAGRELSIPGQVQLRSTSVTATLEDGTRVVVGVRLSESQVLMDFNFHRAATSLETASQFLDRQSSFLQEARAIVARTNQEAQ